MRGPYRETHLMGSEYRRTALWQHNEWRCEYQEHHVERMLCLYVGDQLVETRDVSEMFETLQLANAWREVIKGPAKTQGGATLSPIPDRRICARRAAVRGGRRAADWE